MNAPAFVLAAALLLSGLAYDAAAQAIPADIPDTPGESPGDRTRARVEEGHRSLLSRAFVSSHVAVAPSGTSGEVGLHLQFDGGVRLASGDAVYLAAGSRVGRTGAPGERESPWYSGGESYFVAVGYDLQLARIFPALSLPDLAFLGLAVGGIAGDEGTITFEVQPKYVVPINRYWSLPLGLKVMRAFATETSAVLSGTFVGLSVGVRSHFGQRDVLK